MKGKIDRGGICTQNINTDETLLRISPVVLTFLYFYCPHVTKHRGSIQGETRGEPVDYIDVSTQKVLNLSIPYLLKAQSI